MNGLPDPVWKKLTTTVGLVSTRRQNGVNVMSAEWTYFVNKEPLYASVVLSPRSATKIDLEANGEFGLTLCAANQAALADFAGSFSTTEVEKATSELIVFGRPVATDTPWVRGGVLGMECRLSQIVDLPVHRMYIAEVVATHAPEEDLPPLIKHGGMFQLGDPAPRTEVVAAARLLPGGVLRVAATGPATERDEWQVSLLLPDGVDLDLGTHASADYGDFLVELPMPVTVGTVAGTRVRVRRPGARPGYAALRDSTPS